MSNLVYSDQYNIKFYGLEKIHPFDSSKWKNIVDKLQAVRKLEAKRDGNARDEINMEVNYDENNHAKDKASDQLHGEIKDKENNRKDETKFTNSGGKAEHSSYFNSGKQKWNNFLDFIGGKDNSEKTEERYPNKSGPRDAERSPEKKIWIGSHEIHRPDKVSQEDLERGHDKTYLHKLMTDRDFAARILEVPSLMVMGPIRHTILDRFQYHVGGTIKAAELALENQWGINIGGGFHHAWHDDGGGFCAYADISIAIKKIKVQHEDYKFMIIDLDAHQGNGHERDFKEDKNVFIFDMYNEGIYPFDEEAKKRIDVNVGLMSYTKDKEYLDLLNEKLLECFEKFTPNLVVYNAGTDCLVGDPLGRLSISAEGIMKRDEMVFEKAKEKGCPIVMVTSGGYQKNNAQVIADSIWNLLHNKIIQ